MGLKSPTSVRHNNPGPLDYRTEGKIGGEGTKAYTFRGGKIN